MEYYCGKELHDKILLFEEKFDCEPIVQALTKLKEWSDKKYFPSGFITGDPNGTYINVFAGICAMDIQTQGYTTTIIREQQDINNYGVFPFPNEKGGRMAYWGNMIQLNGKLTSAKLEDCMKYLGFVFSNENTARYASNFTLPLPRQDATLPADRPQLGQLWDFVSRNGGFTITDQAFPTEICDALFRAQDGIINNQITPKDGAGMVQTAIDNYLKNR